MAMLSRVDAHRLGTTIRTLRIRLGLRQVDVARRARVSESDVSRVERGLADRIPGGRVQAVASAVDGWLDYSLRWRGGELDRIIGQRHAGMHEALARWLAEVGGWELAPEVSFSIYGERGVIDALAWRVATRTLLVVELKTELVDVSELLGTFDRKRRLATRVAADRGWVPAVVGAWLLVADGRSNHRRLEEHRVVLRAALPDDGRRIEGWLRAPGSPLAALSFLPFRHSAGLGVRLTATKRVRRRRLARTDPAEPAVIAHDDG